MELSNKAKQKIMRMQTYAKFPYLIEITRTTSKNQTEVFRYSNSFDDKEFEGNTYKAGWFMIEPPEERQDGISDAKLTISAIDTEHNWIGKIRDTQKRATVRFVAVIEHYEDGDTVIEPIEDNTYLLTVVDWNEKTIQWTMIFDELKDIQVPLYECNSFTVPALA